MPKHAFRLLQFGLLSVVQGCLPVKFREAKCLEKCTERLSRLRRYASPLARVWFTMHLTFIRPCLLQSAQVSKLSHKEDTQAKRPAAPCSPTAPPPHIISYDVEEAFNSLCNLTDIQCATKKCSVIHLQSNKKTCMFVFSTKGSTCAA